MFQVNEISSKKIVDVYDVKQMSGLGEICFLVFENGYWQYGPALNFSPIGKPLPATNVFSTVSGSCLGGD